jgi:hypothetical protein
MQKRKNNSRKGGVKGNKSKTTFKVALEKSRKFLKRIYNIVIYMFE